MRRDWEPLLISQRNCRICCQSNSRPTKMPRLSGLDSLVLGDGQPLVIFSWARRCLCRGQHHCYTWMNISGEVVTQLRKPTEQATWLQKGTPSTGSLFDLFDRSWFGSWGLWLPSTLQMLGIILFNTHSNSLLVLCSLRSFTCMCVATGDQTNDLPLPRMPKMGWRKQPTKGPQYPNLCIPVGDPTRLQHPREGVGQSGAHTLNLITSLSTTESID